MQYMGNVEEKSSLCINMDEHWLTHQEEHSQCDYGLLHHHGNTSFNVLMSSVSECF